MPTEKPETTEAQASRKSRHSIMRALQRADWALQEDDAPDALNAIVRAIRSAAKMDSYLDRPEGLSKILAGAVEVALEADLSGDTMHDVLAAASPLLVLTGEKYRECDYGM
jgi:hypothetical protein